MLPAPNLDDRHFQDLVDDAKRFVQRRLPEWSDHNVSDPGVTLIEAVAGMVDQLTYRLNQVPRRTYLAFLDLIGMTPLPATHARAPLTFYLSAPQPDPVVVPRGTEVSTRRTGQDAVVFGTTADLVIPPVELAGLASQRAGERAVDQSARMSRATPVPAFGRDQPQPGDTLLVALDRPAPACVVVLRMECPVGGHGVDPRDPPFVWEAWTGRMWAPCTVESDHTGALNSDGDVVLRLPGEHAMLAEPGRHAAWLRCRLVPLREGQPGYADSPTIAGVSAFTIGGTVDAVNASAVDDEVLGTSEGVPGQVLQVSRPPMVRAPEATVVEVSDGDGWQPWEVVEHFGDSAPESRHVVVDPFLGQVRFGPGLREPDGSMRQHGAVPPRGATVRLHRYWTGGGAAGNVGARTLTVLRSPRPYLDRVVNHQAAAGGVDAEGIDEAVARGPLFLRTLDRAVTAEDYEDLARRAAPEAARVRCVPAGDAAGTEGAGGVRVLVVPAARPVGRLQFGDLVPEPELLERVRAYLEERRALGARVVVEPPFYQGVTVVAQIIARPGASVEVVTEQALDALYAFLDPVTGGTAGTGWPFGRPVHIGELYARLQVLPGTELVEEVLVVPADPVRGSRGEPATRIALDANALPFSYDHQVRVRVASEGV